MEVDTSSGLAHRRGKSSLSSTGSGAARPRVNYADAPPMVISPPSQAMRYAQGGIGANGMAYSSPPPTVNGLAGSSGSYDRSANDGNNIRSYGPPLNSNMHTFAPGSQQYMQAPNQHTQSNGGSAVAPASQQRSRPRRPDTEEIKRVARVHYEELFKFLRSHLAKGQRGPRTNAREKLTRLSQQQFTELSTDVYDELMRRVTNARTGSEIPHLAVREEFHPKRNQARQKLATLPRARFKDLSSDVFFELERRFPQLRDEFRPEVSERERLEEEEAAQRQRQRQNSILSNRGDGDDELGSTTLSSERRDETETVAQPSTSDVVIPTKSTLVEERIAVPYADPQEDLTPGSLRSLDKVGDGTVEEIDNGNTSIRDSVVTNDQDNNRSTMYSQASSIGTGFFNGYAASRATESVASPNPARSSQMDGFTSSLAIEKIRSDYEFRIATLQQKVTMLEAKKVQAEQDHGEGVLALQSELDTARSEHESKLVSLKNTIDEHQDSKRVIEARLTDTLTQFEELQHRHRALESSRAVSTSDDKLEAIQRDYAEQEELVTELRGEVSSLVEELRQQSARNDDLLHDKDTDQAIIRDLNGQVASYRRKYENAKTELRNLKATSQLFVQPPKADDFMPPSDSGAIADIALTGFQSSIDDLLAAARSKTPSNVLLTMKTVVLAATLVTDDVTKFEQRDAGASNKSLDVQSAEQLAQIKSRISSTLNNLMTACRNHASSHGLSPVSLLDAAASHVSAAIVDVVKLVKVRKATKEEAEEFEATFTQNGTLPNGLKPLLGSSNLANRAREGVESGYNSPASEIRRRNGQDDERMLLNTPSAADSSINPSARSFSPRLRQANPPLGRYSPVSYRADITRKNSSGEGSWKLNSDRSRNASISSNSSQMQQTNDRVAPAVPTIASALLRAASNQSVSSSTAPRSPNGKFASHGDTALPLLGSSSVDSSAMQASADDEMRTSKSFTSTSDSGRNLMSESIITNHINSDTQSHAVASMSAHPHPPSLLDTPPPPPPPAGTDETSEPYWAELRNYIEVQTEAIVHCIQALLSSIREGAQGNQLHENLTQITTIVSSIVAISKDNIPRAAAAAATHASPGGDYASRAAMASADGERILRELSEHCEKLIEMQTIGGQFDKTTKSNMASASYGVAKGLKALNGLLNLED